MMTKKVGIEVSIAIAEAARLANVDVVAAYPITPQTHIVEHLAELVANGELDARYIPVESEHSVMSACIGSSATGARTFTASAGQGLELMHEVLYVASSMRLPIVMAVANRALSGPLSVWGDHSDVIPDGYRYSWKMGRKRWKMSCVPSVLPKITGFYFR
jgi:pyruvate ferredoxin oxidoreductase alpha subunit